MVLIVEDVMQSLAHVSNDYRRGRHPDTKIGSKIARALRGVADELEL